MIPTPIPDELVQPGTIKRTFAGPAEDPSIQPCEALVSRGVTTGAAIVRVRLDLEPGELERLNDGAPVWLTMQGGLAPFDVRVDD